MLSFRNHPYIAAFSVVQLLFLILYMSNYGDIPRSAVIILNECPSDNITSPNWPSTIVDPEAKDNKWPTLRQKYPCMDCPYPTPAQDPPETRRRGWMLIDDSGEIYHCDEQRAATFFANNPKYANTTVNKTGILFDNLQLAAKILNSLDIPFFITHGTLLGWYRECGIIKHTNDVDLGIPIDEIMNRGEEVKQAFFAEGFELFNQFGTVKKGFELSFKRRKSKVDLFSFYRDIERVNDQAQEILWNALSWEDEFIRRMWFPMERFIYINMSGEIVLAPSNAERWLQLDYGDNWFNPVSKWGWWDGPANYLDEEDISQTLTAEEEMAMFGENLIKNPSFEEIDRDGRLVDWKQNGNPVLTTNLSNVFHGRRSIQMTNVRGATKYTGAVYQELYFDITKPTRLLISGWGKKDRIHHKLMASIDFMVYVDFWNHAGERRWWKTWACFEQQTTDWQYKYKILYTSDLKKAKFWLLYRNQPGTGWFDDVSFRVENSCPNDCSDQGTCAYTKCICFEGYRGEDCSDTVDELPT